MKGIGKRLGATCSSWESKQNIMSNKKKLGEESVYIENDLTFRERENKKEVLEKAKSIKDTGMQRKIGYNKVMTENETWLWNEKDKKWFQRERKGMQNTGK